MVDSIIIKSHLTYNNFFSDFADKLYVGIDLH